MSETEEKVFRDISRLLHHVDSAEADYLAIRGEDQISFGHPVPPQLFLVDLTTTISSSSTSGGDATILFAYTKHCVSAQVFTADMETATAEPISVCVLHGDDDDNNHHDIEIFPDAGGGAHLWAEEQISCLTAVILEPDQYSKIEVGSPSHHESSSLTNEQQPGQGLTEQRVWVEDPQKSPAQVLLRGVLSEEESTQPVRLAVVFGTSTSRLYSVELSFNWDSWILEPARDYQQHGGPCLFEVLPIDHDLLIPSSKYHVPFQPSGSVSSLSCFQINKQRRRQTYLWIAYGDGTVVRLHHAGVFPSIWRVGAKLGKSLDDVIGSPALSRYHVCLPSNETDLQVVPLPKFHPSLLSPVSSWNLGDAPELASITGDEMDHEDESVVKNKEEPLEALVYGTLGSSDYFPTLVFYSSEVQIARPEHLTRIDSGTEHRAIGAATRLVGGVLGTALGALRWGLGRSRSQDQDELMADVEEEKNIGDGTSKATSPFPTLWSRPIELCAGQEFHDPPRRIEMCLVDPDGNFAAATDNLGRVLVFDLCSKQLIRLFKGYREARVQWVTSTATNNQAKIIYLVIHSRHRFIVESWCIQRHNRISSVQVNREAHLIPSTTLGQQLSTPSCYLVHSSIPGASHNILEKIDISKTDSGTSQRAYEGGLVSSSITSSRAAAHRLQHLQQLLSATNVTFTTQDVYTALTEIQLGDLSAALDYIGGATIIEEKLGAIGADFHKIALAYCVEQEAIGAGKPGADANPHVKTLSKKIQFHSQIVKAYDIIRKFETAGAGGSGSKRGASPTAWAAEAIGWATTYEKITSTPLDSAAKSTLSGGIRFSDFFLSCTFPHRSDDLSRNGLRIYFSDSSRTRREVVPHVFNPLLGDIFSFNVVSNVFEALGIRDDTNYLLQCFGEYFMLLSKTEISGVLTASNPPMVRFLRDLLTRQFQNGDITESGVALEVLLSFCRKSEDLVRSFMLATVCREAIVKASGQTERLSYGKVASRNLVEDWELLLRRLRVCLLVSLRLFGIRLPAPLSVEHVDQGDVFSVYEWLAYDELSMSHSQEEIASLEKACSMSSFAFDPSTPDGDGTAKFKILQNSCLAGQISEEERAEYLVDFDDDDRFGALLLFLRNHIKPPILAAHRSLLLANEWVRNPRKLGCLHDSYLALNSMRDTANGTITVAVCMEIWKQCSSAFRAHLFGFDDVPDFNEEVLGPLLANPDWFLVFGRTSLQFLSILRNVKVDPTFHYELAAEIDADATWPPVRTDQTINRLVGLLGDIEKSAVDTHCVVICALLVSRNTEALVRCVPTIYDCFLPSSLSLQTPESANVVSFKYSFIEEAVVAAAHKCHEESLDRFDLDEIETLAHIWGIGSKVVRTTFLLAMYDIEKDKAVGELLARSTTQIDVRHFIERGVDIVCHRLAAFLNGNRMDASRRRTVMGLVDADLVYWVEQRRKAARWLVEVSSPSTVSIESTRVLVMHLLSLCTSANVDPSLRSKIHSLVVLSGVLMKELTGSTLVSTKG